MGSIQKRGANSWRLRVQFTTPEGTEFRYKTIRMDPNLPEDVQRLQAQKELANMEASLAGPLLGGYTLRTWSDEWLRKHLALDCSPVTISNYRFLLDSRILPQLGDVPLSDLTPALLTDWLISVRTAPRFTTRKADEDLVRPRRASEKLVPPSKLKKPLSTKTVLNYYGCMYAMLQTAARLGYIDMNPMDRVQRPKQHKQKKVFLTQEGAVQLIRDIQDAPQPYRLAVLLALLCGMRLGEIVALRYTDIDLQQNVIHVTHAVKYTSGTGEIFALPKTDESCRDIAIPPALADILHEARLRDQMIIMEASRDLPEGEHPVWSDPVWVIHGRDGQRLNKDTPSKWFRKFADSHGYPDLHFHDLRHAHASILVANNLDVAAVAHRMGHTDPSVTLSTYTHAFDTRDHDAADILGSILREALPDQDDDGDLDGTAVSV